MIDELYAKIVGTQTVDKNVFGIPVTTFNTPNTVIHNTIRNVLLERSPDSVFIGYRLFHLNKIIRTSVLAPMYKDAVTSLDLPSGNNPIFEQLSGPVFDGVTATEYLMTKVKTPSPNIVKWYFRFEGNSSSVTGYDPYTNQAYTVTNAAATILGNSGYSAKLNSPLPKTHKESITIYNPYSGNCLSILNGMSANLDIVQQLFANQTELANVYKNSSSVEDKIAAFLLAYLRY